MNNIYSKKYNIIHNSISPPNNKIHLKDKNKIKKIYSFLNRTVYNKRKLNNNRDNKEKILLNNFLKESNNKKNSSLFIKKNNSDSLKAKLHNSNSTRKINNDLQNIINKKNIKGMYINNFLKAFNNSMKSQRNFPITQREYKKK